MCEECYSDYPRITPLLKPQNCLKNHTQYICGTCGRCICIEKDPKRGVQRWNFPFSTLEKAKLYLRTADYTMRQACGIYEIQSAKGRIGYHIFIDQTDLENYLKKHKDKTCKTMKEIFKIEKYQEYPHTQVRKLTLNEVEKYLQEKDAT